MSVSKEEIQKLKSFIGSLDVQDESDEDDIPEVEYIKPKSVQIQQRTTIGWAACPTVVLDIIFAYLPIKSLSRCAQTCYKWYEFIHFGNCGAWDTFVYKDYVFTMRRYTSHTGWMRVTDHWKLRFLIQRALHRWRNVIIKPVTSLFNLYEFLRVLTNFTEFYEKQDVESLSGIRCFEFDWQLHIMKDSATTRAERRAHHDALNQQQSGTVNNDVVVYGTGGRVLVNLNHFVSHLKGLKYLALRNLQLDIGEADAFMQDLLRYFSDKLQQLCIINLTKLRHSFLHFGCYLNLQKLVVSAQHLNDDTITVISGLQELSVFIIIQDDKTVGVVPCSKEVWMDFTKTIRQRCYNFELQLRIRGWRCLNTTLCIQPSAPVTSIVLDTPTSWITATLAQDIVEHYANTLRSLVQCGLQRRRRSRKFGERCDSHLLLIVRKCRHIKQLAIRERLSTQTVILVALLLRRHQLCPQYTDDNNITEDISQQEIYNLFNTTLQTKYNEDDQIQLCVRRNALLKRADWPFSNALCDRKYFSRTKHAARDYLRSEGMISQLLEQSTWHFLSDNDYFHYFQRYGRKVIVEQSI